ncbi:MAG: dNTP triphosphohydrolase [Planctomycetaceae bacterium]|nr:MAG: dNTP triphosphohydrolase [Planctomycetaceae bacterium]
MVHDDFVTSVVLQTVAQREATLLAPYAMHSADSKGRKYPESEQPYRGPFQRDRDRIVHSSAYRRLSGKMQVFTGEMGDYHRTRLTHTHEVASIARTIGRALRLNEDLIEALALFHDIGHPPFGHAGEDALNECLADQGGFSHNHYALVIAEQLEARYQSFPGLNLTFEVLESQATRVDKTAGGPAPLLEAQVVEAADSMTYDAHDTDDAVKLELVSLDELAEIPLIRDTISSVRQRFGGLRGKLLRKAVVHELIDRQVTDLLQTTGRALARCRFANADAARRSEFRIGPSPTLAERKEQLESFLYQRVYRHPQLVAVRSRAQQQLRAMFAGYCRRPALLPQKFRDRAETIGIAVAVGDYLAGMTDRYCEQQFRLYFENQPT